MGKATKVGELRRGESGRSTRLERTAKEQLGGKERGEVHIKRGPGGGHIGGGLAGGGGVDVRDIDATRIAVRKPLEWDGVIGTVGLVGETSVVWLGEFGALHGEGNTREKGGEEREREE